MLVKPSVAELLKDVRDNRYALVIMTSRRARQIASGSPKLTSDNDRSPVTLAAHEIAEGKVYKKYDPENDDTENKEDKE